MLKRLILINLIFIMVVNLLAGGAAGQNSYKVDRNESTLGIHEIEGDIIAIDAANVSIFKAGVSFRLKMAPQVKILCNGLVASWQSLRPITQQAFFDSRVVLSGLNQVILLDGFYQGEECIIQGWRFDKERLCLQLISVIDHQNKWRFVKSDALLPAEQWLVAGQVIYVLYNRDDLVRGVYLPD